MKAYAIVGLALLVVAALALPARAENKANSPGPSNVGGHPRIAGGPDDFGYVFMDNAETACQGTYNYVDIHTTGTATNLVGQDDSDTGPWPIGFSFSFYGTAQTQFFVGSNGPIYFQNAYLGLGNVCPLPATQGSYGVNTFIALYHDDLIVQANGEVYYQTYATCPVGAGGGQCTVIQYYNVSAYSGSGSDNMDFEAVLFADGTIIMQYLQPANASASQTNGGSATVGIQGIDTSPPVWALQYSCDTASLHPSLAVVFAPPTAQSDGVPNQCVVPVQLQRFTAQ